MYPELFQKERKISLMKKRSLFSLLILTMAIAFCPVCAYANESEPDSQLEASDTGLDQEQDTSQTNEGSNQDTSESDTSGSDAASTSESDTSDSNSAPVMLLTAPASGSETSGSETSGSDSAPTSEPEQQMGQASKLDEIMSAPPTVYNQALAEISAELSNKAYGAGGADVREYLVGYGFDSNNIGSYNYHDSFAYTLAVKDYFGEDKDDTKILVMAARGSVTNKELVGDATTEPKVDYDGYLVYTIVDTFYKEIEKNLDKYKTEGSAYKILSTGHSLGGAVANLFAAMETKNSDSEVYGYTFGAIDSIKSPEKGKTVEEGYENIHNIYNDWDTFSPRDQGYTLTGGAGSKYGKFGHMDSYEIDRRTEAQKKDWPWNKVKEHVNHNMDYYVTDTYNKAFSCPEAYGGDDGYKEDETASVPTSTAAIENTSQNAFPISKDVAQVVGSLYAGKPVDSSLAELSGAFSDHIQLMAAAFGTEIISTSPSQLLGVNEVVLQNLAIMRDKNGKVIVLMELANTSGSNIFVGLDSVISNDVSFNVAPWKSQVIAPGKKLFVAISLNSITDVNAKTSLPLNVYAADGTLLSTTDAINVIK